MRTKPNYEKAKNVALWALENSGITEFPIDIPNLISKDKKIKIITYTEMAYTRNCTLEEIIEANASEDGVIHYKAERNSYMIVYNDTIKNKNRIYWTLAHEYGHYLLNHHKETNRSSLTRVDLTDIEYDLYEKEANFFAKYFIAPPPLILEAGLTTEEKIRTHFSVSESVAEYTLDYVNKQIKKGFNILLPTRIKVKLKTFLDKIHNGLTCADCQVFSYLPNTNYCPNCGSNNLEKHKKGVDFMKFHKIELDEDSKAIVCPKCKNESIDGDYCQVCGIYTINICSVADRNGEVSYQHSDFEKFMHEQSGCYTKLSGNARFCHNCGNFSTFNVQNLLVNWEYENDPFSVKSDEELKAEKVL